MTNKEIERLRLELEKAWIIYQAIEEPYKKARRQYDAAYAAYHKAINPEWEAD